MAQKEFDFSVLDDGKEKHFKIKEMPAVTGFFFGAKVTKFIFNNDAKLSGDEDIARLFMKSIGGINIAEFEAIVDEALAYVIYVDGVSPRLCNGDALNSILVDPANVLLLVKKTLEVNLSFIKRAFPVGFLEKINGALKQAGLSPNLFLKDTK